MSEYIRVRVCLVIIDKGKILLVPHYHTDVGFVQWVVPGGMLEFGETMETAAIREFFEETGFQTVITELFDISEEILPEKHYHSITISFCGKIIKGELKHEEGHAYGVKTPKWFTMNELKEITYHPVQVINKAISIIKK